MTEDIAHKRTFTISNEKGLHARPATRLAKAVSQFDAEVTITKDGQKVNAKSIISILILAASRGSQVTVGATGPQSREAIEAVAKLFEMNFDEP